ncbi:hypothetical protein [Burkholderia pseudomultivorans]|uniref:Lipoprotein n=1 Tax=Burkholderia pseudomultivorans TaxID=1207504 RepID=A0ABU2E0N3_9BURK|nr:hypothetical protein [Burkholderia pseudomultivorans]MDR8727384.1 hypothetical protein [Burkholderia pseudomultivorans]MDR8732524.1 hypothetical protein [Burkholderia pseudomultivorans]MDR8739390.1 hypothetical protein [Burkholderia pseudomultivorans]MDR8753414.1 hypothetical protein [Burkholderia pseudomultivorans]MDR8775382.1 hypothetical protein [Burkholderia pseudomultivorans]
MQRYSLRHVSRAVFAGILIAGLAAGAGCQKKADTGDTSSGQGATGGMSPAPSTAPGAGASAPGAASSPSGVSGG